MCCWFSFTKRAGQRKTEKKAVRTCQINKHQKHLCSGRPDKTKYEKHKNTKSALRASFEPASSQLRANFEPAFLLRASFEPTSSQPQAGSFFICLSGRCFVLINVFGPRRNHIFTTRKICYNKIQNRMNNTQVVLCKTKKNKQNKHNEKQRNPLKPIQQ